MQKNFREVQTVALVALGAVLASGAGGAELLIYPSAGQSDEQLDRDKYECHAWAKKQTGFDPTQVRVVASGPAPRGRQASVVGTGLGGAARGAAVGAVGGRIAGKKKTRKGAKVGAAVGGILGAMKAAEHNQRVRAEEQRYAQQQAARHGAVDGQHDQYLRATSLCLEGRGYTVSR